MIITCEKCNSSFYVQDKKIPDDGRKVRCAKCTHTWHQMPEGVPDPDEIDAAKPEGDDSGAGTEAETDAGAEDVAADDADKSKTDAGAEGEDQAAAGENDDADLINALGLMSDENTRVEQDDGEDDGKLDIRAELEGGDKQDKSSSIPDAIKPLKFGKDSLPIDLSKVMSEKNIGHAVNYGSPLLVFLFVFVFLVLTKGIWVSSAPSMAGFYNFFGIGVHTAGVGLVFEDVTVQPLRHKDSSRSLLVSGRVLNQGKRSTKIPAIKAQATQLDGTVVAEWFTVPEKSELSAAESMAFKTVLEKASKDIDEVNLKFALLGVEMDDEKEDSAHHDDAEHADKGHDTPEKSADGHDRKDDAHH